MDVAIRKVGNSAVVTIPQDIINQLNVKIGDSVEMSVENKIAYLKPKRKRLRGELFLEDFYGKSYDKIGMIDTEDIDTGEPVGEEAW